MIPANGIVKGSPADDPTCNLWCFETMPDPAVFGPGPYRGILLFPPGTYHTANPQLCLAAARDLAARGFMCWSCTFRAITDLCDGQTTDGRFSQPITDCRVFIAAMRADPRLKADDPFAIGVIGGSSGGHFAHSVCFTGTVRADWGIAISGAVNCAERRAETYTYNGDNVVDRAASFFRDFCGTGAALPDDTAPNLAIMLADSPITLRDHAIDCPFQIYCSEFDPMPFHQHTDAIEDFETYPVSHWSHYFAPGSNLHAFKGWDLYKDMIFPFADDPTSIDSGGHPPPPPPPPPDQEPTGFYIAAVSDDGALECTFPDAMDDTGGRHVLTPDRTSAAVVPPAGAFDTFFNATLQPFNAWGLGPISTYRFKTPSSTAPTLKAQPRGTFDLPTSNHGNWGDISALPSWTIARLAGLRLRGGINFLEPTEGNFDPTAIDDALALAVTNNKDIGLSIAWGINTPQWVFDAGAKFIIESGPDQGRIPLLWDPIYQQKHRDACQYFGDRWDSHAKLKYIVCGGLGQVVESIFVTTPNYAEALALAQADGYADLGAALLAGWKVILQNWHDACPTTRLIVSLLNPFPAGAGGTTMLRDAVAFIDANFPTGKFGFMQAGLQAGSTDAFVLNQIVKDHSPTCPAGFQFAHTSTDVTDFTDTMDAGLALLWKYAELYPNDSRSSDPTKTAKIESNNTAMALLP